MYLESMGMKKNATDVTAQYTADQKKAMRLEPIFSVNYGAIAPNTMQVTSPNAMKTVKLMIKPLMVTFPWRQ